MSSTPLTRELTGATAIEVAQLQRDGYVIHQEWANGVEMRKGRPLRAWLAVLQVLIVLMAPKFVAILFARSIANNLFGFKHRVLVTLDSNDADLHFF